MKKLLIILFLLPFLGQAQTTYQLNYDSIRVNKTAGTGGTSLYGKVYLKNVSAGLSTDSALVVRNGRIFKFPAIPTLSFGTFGATPNAQGGSFAAGVITLQPASASFPGGVTTGTQTFAGDKTIQSSGSGNTLSVNHASGSGIALSITKGGNGEGIYVNKTSGSGNAATIIGTLNATTLVKSGGTSSQFLKADGTVDGTAYGTGSVTSVAALTLGTTGTDLSSSVANGTTTPVITLNVPDASATARGVVTTGAQTFAGAKTFTDIIKANSSVGLVILSDAATTGLTYQAFQNTGGQMKFGISSSAGSAIFSNESAYATVFGSGNNTSLQFATNNIVRGTFSGSGDLSLTGSISSTPQGTLYGTAAGSITSAQLAASLTDETGTGSAVFSASPTFTGTVTTAALSGTSATFSGDGSFGSTGVANGTVTILATDVTEGRITFGSASNASYAQIAGVYNGGTPVIPIRILGSQVARFSTATFDVTSTITTGAPSGGTAKPFKIGNVATVSPTSPNRTIEIEIDGTTYYLTAKTTNN